MLIGGKIRNVPKVELSNDAYPVLVFHVGVGDYNDLDEAILTEKKKIEGALNLGADLICDVSMSDEMAYVHKKFLEAYNVPFGTVSAYEAYITAEKNALKYKEENFLELL